LSTLPGAEPAWPLAVIVGPTASGKSAVALGLAENAPVEIVSCDSLQVYRGMDIGSAKPSLDERRRVRHHLIDVAEPHEGFSAARYSELGRAALAEVRERGHWPLVVGGSGLYLRALLFGLSAGPARDEPLRRRLERIAARRGDAALHGLLARVDPLAAARIHPRDRLRAVRALEVYRLTRRRLTAEPRSMRLSAPLQEPGDPLNAFDVALFGLNPPRTELRARVEARAAGMLEAGLLEETRGLLERYPGSPPRPLQAIGYRQAVDVLQGRCTRDAAFRQVVTRTMQYAKRQMTWFRHQARVSWYPDADGLTAAVKEFWVRPQDRTGAPSA